MVRNVAVVAIALLVAYSSSALAGTTTYKGYSFEAYVAKANGKRYKEFTENNRSTLKVRPNEEYSIVVKNPMPVRVGVAVTIDGLNSIDGKRTTPRESRKWIIEPNSSITVSGWQTTKQTLRKFVFKEQAETYAQWQEDKTSKPVTQNMGVVGIAWFWNSGELEAALHPPEPFVEEEKQIATSDAAGNAKTRGAPAAPSAAPSAAKAESKAGTGMGKEQQHAVTTVEFSPDAGMYALKDVLKIFYEFAKLPPEPQPFAEEEDEDGRFAPDMHK
jgi:hypothetical protein